MTEHRLKGAQRLAFLVVAMLALIPLANGQTGPTEPSPGIVGRWVAQTIGCGTTVLVVTSVKNGVIYGTLTCTSTGVSAPIKDNAIVGKQMGGRLIGARLLIEGARSTTDLTMKDGMLVGSISGPHMPTRSVSFVRE